MPHNYVANIIDGDPVSPTIHYFTCGTIIMRQAKKSNSLDTSRSTVAVFDPRAFVAVQVYLPVSLYKLGLVHTKFRTCVPDETRLIPLGMELSSNLELQVSCVGRTLYVEHDMLTADVPALMLTLLITKTPVLSSDI